MASNVPFLETERLILREHRPSDLGLCAAMWANPLVWKYTVGVTSSENRSWNRMITYRGLWEFLGYGYWAVEEKATKKYIGDMGFADFRREIDPPIYGIPESGWAFAPESHGKGYGTEALKAICKWADTKFPRTVCLINPENVASVKLAEKVGYREFQRSVHLNQPTIMFERVQKA